MTRRTLYLGFVQPTVPLSINQAHTLHWAPRRARTDPWRDLALVITRRALHPGGDWHGWPTVPVTIRLTMEFRSAARRDPHNYVGTNVKAVVDGLVRGGLIPDDSPEWATILEPAIVVNRDKAQPMVARVHITPRESNP